jgi:hypothetical protein
MSRTVDVPLDESVRAQWIVHRHYYTTVWSGDSGELSDSSRCVCVLEDTHREDHIEAIILEWKRLDTCNYSARTAIAGDLGSAGFNHGRRPVDSSDMKFSRAGFEQVAHKHSRSAPDIQQISPRQVGQCKRYEMLARS